MLLAILPEFDAVDNVLPEHIAARADGGHGIEIGVGHPDGEGGVLLEQGLSAVDLIAQVTADAAAHEEEGEAEYQAHRGNHEEHRQAGIAMDDVAHGDSRSDAELHGPEIEREVGDGHNPGTDALGKVLHIPAQGQRGYQHHRQFLKDDDEGTPEREMTAPLKQGEHRRDHQRRSEGGDDDESRHRIDVSPDLRCDHRSCRRRRTDDAGEDTLPQDLLLRTGLDGKDDPAVERHEQQLGSHHADMPAMRAHLVEIDAAEGGEERAEHHHREDGIDNSTKRIARGIELGHEIEREIDQRARDNGHRQRPVLQKLPNTHKSAAKLIFFWHGWHGLHGIFVILQPNMHLYQ